MSEALKVMVEMQLKSAERGDVLCPGLRVLQTRRLLAGSVVLNAMLASGHCPLAYSSRHLARSLGDDGMTDVVCCVLEKTVDSGVSMDAKGRQSLVACVVILKF